MWSGKRRRRRRKKRRQRERSELFDVLVIEAEPPEHGPLAPHPPTPPLEEVQQKTTLHTVTMVIIAGKPQRLQLIWNRHGCTRGGNSRKEEGVALRALSSVCGITADELCIPFYSIIREEPRWMNLDFFEMHLEINVGTMTEGTAERFCVHLDTKTCFTSVACLSPSGGMAAKN